MKHSFRKWSVVLTVLTLIISACSKNSNPKASLDSLPGTVVLEWNEVAYEAFGGPAYVNSLMASRINAMVHIAMHDAVNGVDERYHRYVFKGKDEKANPIAAAAAAAHAVLIHEIPERKSFIDSALQKTLKGIVPGEARERGLALGIAAAQALLENRKDDGSAGEFMSPVPVSNQPGVYQAVPPFDGMVVPFWENVKLFSLERKDQFRCPPPPALTSEEYAIAFSEIKLKGRKNNSTRTPEQTAYAKFWYEFSEAGWNRIARNAAASQNLGLFETARLFALIDMVLADAYIAGWDSKIYHNFWRPYTAVRKADIDNNPATEADPLWEPSEPTPPIHDYPSTHSALGNAAATVLAELLGDNAGFTFSSPTAIPGTPPRTFNSFLGAADENADSRVMAGIHFRFSCVAGQELGNQIGKWAVEKYLRPVKDDMENKTVRK